ncbi:MAG: hypothetical protein JXB88_05725 [Spirochaetales bacterium]|nr:hypothetical protein [Spirochaetales bacterium]
MKQKRWKLKIDSFLRRVLRNWPPKIISLVAAVLLFVFNRMSNLEEHPLYVPLSIRLNPDYAIAAPIREKISVIVRGDPDLDIHQITPEDIEVYIDLLHVEKEDEYTVPIQYRKIGPALETEPLSIDIEPAVITVKLEKNLQKSVEIEVEKNIKGTPARGYMLGGLTYAPTVVQIVGPRSKVEKVEKATTEVIDLSGRSKNFNMTVRLVSIDPLVKFKGSGYVEFSAVIKEIVEERLFEKKIITSMNLVEHMVVEKTLPEGSILVKAPLLVLDRIKPNDIRLYIDCSNIKDPGKHQKRIKAEVPERVEILSITPETVIVDFVRK